MRNPVEIVLRGIPHSGALERYIAEGADKLDRQCDRIQTCHVVVEALHRTEQQGPHFSVRLNITLPGTEVVVNRENGEDVTIALREAFEAAGLQLRDHMRRQGDIESRSHSSSPVRGRER